MIELGQTIEVKGSGKKPYLLKNIDGVFSCTCPAWRNQSAAIDNDAEAEVIGYTAGKGRHKGRTGALQVRMPNGKEFLLGTGLSDKERETPPMLGATVTYRYTELTTDGIPKCGSYVCTRDYE